MYVCICNGVTDRDIRRAAENGANSLEALSKQLQVATCCGRCADCARDLLDSINNEIPRVFGALAASA